VKVGLTFNLKKHYPGAGEAEDAPAECDEESTVEDLEAALSAAGHQVLPLPYSLDLLDELRKSRPDIVFNLAEGWEGRNRELLVPALLEFLGIPYTGSDPLTLGLALDKAMAKQVFIAAGLPTPRFYKLCSPRDLQEINLEYPLFVKPNQEGSSKGIRNQCLVWTVAELEERVDWLTRTYRQPVIVEEFLSGREFSVGILGNQQLKVLPLTEIKSRPGTEEGSFIYSFEVKSKCQEQLVCPAEITGETAMALIELATRAYRVLECRDLARVDLKLDAHGNPHLLEVNPLPGLARNYSIFTLQASVAGLSYQDLINRILSIAWQRYSMEVGTRK